MIGRMIGPPTSPATTSTIMIGSGTGSRTIHQVFFNPNGADGPSAEVPYRFSAVMATWPATRPAHAFLKFRAHSLNVLPSGFRFLYGDNPADPLIAREGCNILPFCPRRRVRNENFS